MTDTTIQAAVAKHPRAIGALFMLGLFIVQTQPVAAGSVYCHGP